MNLFGELKRRNVIRVAAAYLVLSWLCLQIGETLGETLGLPEWSAKLVFLLLAVGFVPALVFAWVYELTPEGIKREAEIDRGGSITHETGRKLNIVVIVMAAAAIGLFGLDRAGYFEDPPSADATAADDTTDARAGGPPPADGAADPVSRPAAASADDRISIAVLPFVNMSDDPANEYFSDGISEELLNVLVQVDELRVPSRTSSFRFKESGQSLRKIASELGVRHVLEGSVRKAGDQVRITAQLIDVESDAHLWSDTYTRTLDDIFSIQAEIAGAIVDQLKVQLGAGQSLTVVSSENGEAYNHYLRGRFFWHQRSVDGFASAERELRAAVELDPGFGDAWAALADVYVLLPEYIAATPDEAIPRARAALERALAINAESARALTTRGYLRYLYDWQFEDAEADFLAALEIDPRYATAHQWYAEYLMALRRPEQALVHAARAVELDPLAPIKPMVLGNALLQTGDYEGALAAYAQALELAPEQPNVLWNLTRAHAFEGALDAARDTIGRWGAQARAGSPALAVVQAAIEALAGARPVDAVVSELADPRFGCDPYYTPYYLALLGAFDEAMDTLDRCIESGFPYAPAINALRPFEPMRELPRFRAQLTRINLPVEDDA